MTVDIQKLKALAIGASPGPWYLENGMNQVRSAEDDFVCETYENEPVNSAFIAAANPAAVLELVAEIDRLEERNVYWIDQANTIARDRNTLRAERDQLKAENEALRKDAERYRWTSIEGNWVARMFGKWRAHIGEYGVGSPTEWYPSREEAIDAAMSKEAGHD